jgi:hypothetical protein
MSLRTMVCWAALTVSVLFAIPAQSDEIEPEPEPAPQVELEPEPEPEPDPVVVPDVLSEEEGPREPRWIPSLDVGMETFDYNTTTTVRNFVNPPAWTGTQKEAARQLMVRIGGELLGPAMEDLPGKPRLFVQGGVQLQTFSSDLIFEIGDPGVENEPEVGIAGYVRAGNFRGLDLPGAFDGQGSDVLGRFDNPSWYAGLGVAFSMPISTNLLLQFKPSIQYSVEEIDLPSRFTTVDEPVPALDPFPCGTLQNRAPCLREFFAHRSAASASTTDHSVGAGLEIAVVLFRNVRPIRVSLYTEARFMWLVSGSTTTFGDSNGIDPNRSIASYSVERDSFGIKGGGGVRFSWVGFD